MQEKFEFVSKFFWNEGAGLANVIQIQ